MDKKRDEANLTADPQNMRIKDNYSLEAIEKSNADDLRIA